MVSQNLDTEPIENDERGRVYSVSSGSGGFKASHEKLAVDRQEDGTYEIKLITPAGVHDLEEGIESGREAIKKGHKLAGRKISKGMPGSGKISVPDVDFDDIPEEP